MLEKLERLILLYDFYGPLLTERQQQAIELYYEADLSLSEVAQQMGITRQGVYDLLKRTGNALEDYESRLRLAGKFQRDRKMIAQAYQIIKRAGDHREPWVIDVARILAEVLEMDRPAEGSDVGAV